MNGHRLSHIGSRTHSLEADSRAHLWPSQSKLGSLASWSKCGRVGQLAAVRATATRHFTEAGFSQWSCLIMAPSQQPEGAPSILESAYQVRNRSGALRLPRCRRLGFLKLTISPRPITLDWAAPATPVQLGTNVAKKPELRHIWLSRFRENCLQLETLSASAEIEHRVTTDDRARDSRPRGDVLSSFVNRVVQRTSAPNTVGSVDVPKDLLIPLRSTRQVTAGLKQLRGTRIAKCFLVNFVVFVKKCHLSRQ